jgi:hypothetical protein
MGSGVVVVLALVLAVGLSIGSELAARRSPTECIPPDHMVRLYAPDPAWLRDCTLTNDGGTCIAFGMYSAANPVHQVAVFMLPDGGEDYCVRMSNLRMCEAQP